MYCVKCRSLVASSYHRWGSQIPEAGTFVFVVNLDNPIFVGIVMVIAVFRSYFIPSIYAASVIPHRALN